MTLFDVILLTGHYDLSATYVLPSLVLGFDFIRALFSAILRIGFNSYVLCFQLLRHASELALEMFGDV